MKTIVCIMFLFFIKLFCNSKYLYILLYTVERSNPYQRPRDYRTSTNRNRFQWPSNTSNKIFHTNKKLVRKNEYENKQRRFRNKTMNMTKDKDMAEVFGVAFGAAWRTANNQ